jgi:FAD/FMN-containing dehydrogenase
MPLNTPSSDFLNGLKDFLGPQGWRAPEDTPEKFEEPRGKWKGLGAMVLRPETTEEVAEIISRAAAERVAVIPHSGGTGLVGGQVTVSGPPPVLLSVERLSRIRDVDPTDNVLIAEAGVILADIQNTADEADRLFPLSLASEGSCRIGGNLATNAGGVQVLRYGNARDLCLGVEAVLPSGEIIRGLKRLRKDNTGYDIRHLMIGSEGTLGVITAASLKLFPRPAETATAFLAVPGPQQAVDLLNFLRPKVGDVISAFELIDRMGVQFLKDTGLGQPDPLDPMTRWIVLVETGGRPGASDALEAALAEAFEAGLATDGVVAQTEAQRANFWKIRETIPEANRLIGAIASHDISVPVARISEFIAKGEAALAKHFPDLRLNCFGHVGDGNLHFNIYPPKGRKKGEFGNIQADVSRLIHDLTADTDGSISAEHGIGRLKAADLEHYGDPGKLSAMRAIKAALDPHGIMNPGAVLNA